MADRSVVVALRSMGITTYTSEVATASRETMSYDRALRAAGKAADSYARAVAAAGAESSRAVAAQTRYADSLKRVAIAEEEVWVAAERTAAAQVASAEKAAAAQEAAAARQAESMKKVGTVAGGVGLAAAAALGLAAKAAADFNAKMAQVESLSRASSAQLSALSKATQGYANIGVSASQAADAEIELIKAGVGVKDILGGALTGTLNAAAAGQIDVAQATEIASAAMVQFGLAGKDIPHVADLLAAGADKSLGGISDLGEGLKAVGTSAHQFGLTIDQTVGALSQFAAAGLTGSLGGTALKQALLKLEAPSQKAADTMAQFGISLYDAQGNTVTLSNLAGQLQKNLGGVDAATRNAALATIFGSRAVQVANVLYKDGATVTQQWVNKVNDAGFAAEQASGKMDSLQGDLQKLGAEITNAAIGFGQQLQPALRAVTEDLTGFVGFLDHIPGPLKEAAALTIAFTAAVGLGTFAYTRATAALASMGTTLGIVTTETAAAGTAQTTLNAKMLALKAGAAIAGIGLLTLKGHIGDDEAQLRGLAAAAGYAALGFSVAGPWGAAVGGSIGLLTNLNDILDYTGNEFTATAAKADTLRSSLDKVSGTVTQNTRQVIANALVTQGLAREASQYGIELKTLVNAGLNPTGAAMKDLTFRQHDLFQTNAQGAGIIQGLTNYLRDQNSEVGQARKAWQDYVTSTTKNVTPAQAALGNATRQMGGTMLDTAGDTLKLKSATDGATDSTKALTIASDALNGVFEKRITTQAALTLAIASSREATKNLGDVTKGTTGAINKQSVAGATLIQNLAGIATTASQVTGTAREQAAAISQARQAIISQAVAAGAGRAAAISLANSLLSVEHTASAAASAVRQTQAAINALQSKTVEIQVNTILHTIGSAPGGHTVYAPSATGGPVNGGLPGRDSVPKMLMPGEHVWTAAEVKAAGGHGAMYAMRAASLSGQAAGMRSGGQVGRGYTTGSPSRTVIETDPALIVEMRAVRALLTKGIRTTETDPYAIATGVRKVARNEVNQAAVWAETLEGANA